VRCNLAFIAGSLPHRIWIMYTINLCTYLFCHWM